MKLVTTLGASLLLAAYILGVLVAPQSSAVWLYHGAAAAQTAGLAWAAHAQMLLLALGFGMLGGAAIMFLSHLLTAALSTFLAWAILGLVYFSSRMARNMVFQYQGSSARAAGDSLGKNPDQAS